jgi:hypothetical protein
MMWIGVLAMWSLSHGVHELVEVTNCELCCMSFEEREAVAYVGCGAVKSCAGEITHQGDRGAECPQYLALEGVEMCVAEESEQEGTVVSNEKSSNIPDSAGLCKYEGG